MLDEDLPVIVKRQVKAATEIIMDPPEQIDYLHAIMWQVSLPRRAQKEFTFERTNGYTGILLEAGKLFLGGRFMQLPLPYGTRPRLVMVHISTEAVKTQSREIDVGRSMHDYMKTLGIDAGGREYHRFRKQVQCLAACHMTIGIRTPERETTIKTHPIKRFDAWLTPSIEQRVMSPGVIELSEDFYNTLTEHAVPLDKRALNALKHSALSLDVYSWLAHRLHRVNKRGGVKLSWANLRAQFGQEYKVTKDFKRQFKNALRQVLAVYPEAKVGSVTGGLMLHNSPPSVRKLQIITGK